MVAVWQRLVSPVGVMSDVVVVPAKRSQVPDFGRSTMGPGLAMVEVAFDGGHPTAGKDTVAVASLNVPSLGGSGPTSGDAVVNHQPALGVSQSPAPLRTSLVFRDLASDVGDDRPVPGQLARIIS
jgi:hypothetical protein